MVQEIEVSKLNPAPYNPRVELVKGSTEYDKLKRSLETFGAVEPIVWNKRTGNVVGGHQRLKVLTDMGHNKVLCSVVDIDETDEKLLNLALNKIKGQWDYDKLEEILKDFDYEEATASGFSESELAIIFATNTDLEEEDYDISEFEEVEEETYVSGSYILTLIFRNAEFAKKWAESEGYYNQIKTNSSTTVIRVDVSDE